MTDEQRAARDWLSRGYKIDREVAALEAAKQSILDDLTRCTSQITPDKVQTSQVNTSERMMHKYADITMQINRRIDALIDTKAEIAAAINCVEDATQRALLVNRYVNLMRWEYIAIKMDYDYRWIMRLHCRALDAFNIVIHNTPLKAT